MGSIPWLADRLRFAELEVKVVKGWRDRGRPASTGGFDPQGVLIHHTAGALATKKAPHPSLQTIIEGRSDLPGPLSQVLIDWNGVCWVVAAGRSNHAGVAVASGRVPGGDGNSLYVGIEIDYAPQLGQHASKAQRKSSVLAAAAIVSRLGPKGRRHGRKFVSAHKETSVTGKIDPLYLMDMAEFRREVRKVLQKTDWRNSGP
ncbi:MAG: peptidoglycan recognition protein family protein [Rhodoglobus sp.]